MKDKKIKTDKLNMQWGIKPVYLLARASHTFGVVLALDGDLAVVWAATFTRQTFLVATAFLFLRFDLLFWLWLWRFLFIPPFLRCVRCLGGDLCLRSFAS